jgi:hypothetical protein
MLAHVGEQHEQKTAKELRYLPSFVLVNTPQTHLIGVNRRGRYIGEVALWPIQSTCGDWQSACWRWL